MREDRYGRIIRVSHEVFSEIAARGTFGETPDLVLRRVFGLPARVPAKRGRPKGSKDSRPRRPKPRDDGRPPAKLGRPKGSKNRRPRRRRSG